MRPLKFPAQSVREGAAKKAAFTLIEMMTVIAVIAILLVLAVPSMVGSIGGSRITQSGEAVMGAISAAQSRAQSTNRPIEVRIYRSPTSLDQLQATGQNGGPFRGVLVLEYYQPGEADPRSTTVYQKLSKPLAVASQPMTQLPDGVVFSENTELSSMIGNLTTTPAGTTDAQVDSAIRVQGTYQSFTPPGVDYKSFVIYPETTTLNSAGKWFITAVSAEDLNKPPAEVKNFYTVQIDPLSGRATAYRP